MSQKSNPINDAYNSGWDTEPLWESVSKPAAADAPFVSTTVVPLAATYFSVGIAPAAWPQAGQQSFTIRVRKSEPGEYIIRVDLRRADNLPIASRYIQSDVTSEFQNIVITLDDEEKAAITTYHLGSYEHHISCAA